MKIVTNLLALIGVVACAHVIVPDSVESPYSLPEPTEVRAPPRTKNPSIRAIIRQAAIANEVPPEFAVAVAIQESGLNPNATGGVGEIGLFQLKCDTAKTVMWYRGACMGLYDPIRNAYWGTLHLRMALDITGGNYCEAATLHNRGLRSKPKVTAYCRSVIARL